MSKAFKIVLNSMLKNYYWSQEDLEDYFDSLIEFIENEIINKESLLPHPMVLKTSSSISPELQTVKDLILFIQKISFNITSDTRINSEISNTILKLYDITDYESFLKLNLDKIQYYDINTKTDKKIVKLFSQIPEKNIIEFLNKSKFSIQEEQLILYILFSPKIQNEIFEYVDRELFIKSFNNLKTLKLDYIVENFLNHNNKKTNFIRLKSALNNFNDIQNNKFYGCDSIMEALLNNHKSSNFLINNFSELSSEQQNIVRNDTLNKFLDSKIKNHIKPTVSQIYSVDHDFYLRREFNSETLYDFFKMQHRSMFSLMETDSKFKQHIMNLDFNPLSILLQAEYISKENFNSYITKFPELLTQSKNKKNNLINLLSTDDHFEDWYKNYYYIFSKLNLEVFAKKGDDIYINLFDQNFYLSLLVNTDYHRNKKLIKMGIELYQHKLIDYESRHNISNKLSSDYFEIMDLSASYSRHPNKNIGDELISKLNKIDINLFMTIYNSEYYIDIVSDRDEKYKVKLEQLFLNKLLSTDQIKPVSKNRL